MSDTLSSYVLFRIIRSDGTVVATPQTPLGSLQLDQPSLNYIGWTEDQAGNYTGPGTTPPGSTQVELSITYTIQAMAFQSAGDPVVHVLGCTLVGEVLNK